MTDPLRNAESVGLLPEENTATRERAAIRKRAMEDARLRDGVGPWPRFTRVHRVGDYLSQYEEQFIPRDRGAI